MAVDTPAKIAILGAGPIGLEAALYARFLGYEVEIFEQGEVAEHVLRWGHVRLFSPFRMNSTHLGLAAIYAQDENYQPPAAEALLLGREWRATYLLPLANTDLLADHLRLHTKVVSVTRRELLKHELVNSDDREDSPFRIVLADQTGREWDSTADVVLDTTGVYSQPNWLGPGGAPALHERGLRPRIRYDLPDVNGTERERYANKQTLVIGSGYSAAQTIAGLIELAAAHRETKVLWVTRESLAEGASPIAEIPDDPLPERALIARAANQAPATSPGVVVHRPGTRVASVGWDEERRRFDVQLEGSHAGQVEVDEIIANVGYRPDNTLYSELQVHECYATGGPMKLAAQLSETPTADCLQEKSHGPESLMNPEPHFYILGAKSYGRNSKFLVSIGHTQIRELFTVIGEREDLDLYQGAKRLIPPEFLSR